MRPFDSKLLWDFLRIAKDKPSLLVGAISDLGETLCLCKARLGVDQFSPYYREEDLDQIDVLIRDAEKISVDHH